MDKRGRKRKGIFRKIILLVVLVILIILFILNFSFIQGIFNKITGRQIQEQLPLKSLIPPKLSFNESSGASYQTFTQGMYRDIDFISSPSFTGTQFNLRIRVVRPGQGQAVVDKIITLYDDGMHDDGIAGDKRFGNHFLIDDQIPPGYYYFMMDFICSGCQALPASESYGDLKVLEKIQGQCKEFVAGKNDPNDKTRINLIFMGIKMGTTSGTTFTPDWNSFFSAMDNHLFWDETKIIHNRSYAFFNRAGIIDYKNKFNIWYIDPMYSGDLKSNVDTISFFYEYMLSRCSFQNSYFITYDPSIPFSGIGYTPVAVRPGTTGTLSHELGHNIAHLYDEYSGINTCDTTPSNTEFGVTLGSFDAGFTNIYKASVNTNDRDSCMIYTDWSYLIGTCIDEKGLSYSCQKENLNVSCHSGGRYCSADTSFQRRYYWRPAFETMMFTSRAYPSSVDVTAFCKVLSRYTGDRLGVCKNICLDGCPKGWRCDQGVCRLPTGGCPDGDTDGDKACNLADNCINIPNPDQRNLDGDSLGDACDGDKDGDIYGGTSDCNDLNPAIRPNAQEICGNGIDENCNPADDICPVTCIDNDKDGYGANCPLGPDCDDSIAGGNIHPGVNEIGNSMCDGRDNDCNGQIDGFTRSCWTGHDVSFSTGICKQGSESCINGAWNGICSGQVFPQAESCVDGSLTCPICVDGKDNNCDGIADKCGCKIQNARWSDNLVQNGEIVDLFYEYDLPWNERYNDNCFDFQFYKVNIYREGQSPPQSVFQPSTELPTFTNIPQFESFPNWITSSSVYCDESTRICKSPQYYFTVEKRNDPLSRINSNMLTVLWECDEDGDLYLKQECIPSQSANGIYDNSIYDCLDLDANVNPEKNEIVYNNKDDDCDLLTKDDDLDGDGFFSVLDCNDASSAINPGADDLCNGIDDNCNSQIDEGCSCINGQTRVCGSNIGECTQGTQLCSNGLWETCSGKGPTIEICDNKDNNCNGFGDEPYISYYEDNDRDGFGDPLRRITACTQPINSVSNDFDCDDSSALIKPGANEICDNKDNNCNGFGDEPYKILYLDSDRDGFGDKNTISILACPSKDSYSPNFLDCDDSDPTLTQPVQCSYNGTSCGLNPICARSLQDCPVPPPEICGNGNDENCNGMTDNICPTKAPVVYVINPQSSNYVNSLVPLSFFTFDASNCWYQIDGIFVPSPCSLNVNLDLIEGNHNLNIFANNFYGTTNVSKSFTVSYTRRFLVKYDKFKGKGSTTNLDLLADKDLENITLVLHLPNYGKIEFIDSVNLTKNANPATNVTDLDGVANISQNRIEIRGEIMPSLNKRARITLESVFINRPVILRDGNKCGALEGCIIESNINGKIVFTVESFSIYSAEEESAAQAQDASGSSKSSGGSGGGGAIISAPKEFKISWPEIIQGKEIVLKKNEKAVVEDEDKGLHIFSLADFNAQSATLKFQNSEILLKPEIAFFLDIGDNRIEIRYLSRNITGAEIYFKALSRIEEISSDISQVSVESTETFGDAKKLNLNFILIIIISLIAIVFTALIIVIIRLYRNRRIRDNF